MSRRASLAVLAAVALMGALRLPTPFHGDAALYQLGAQALASGEMLYVDFWDHKNPGIYLLHYLAGTLFGFGEVGLRLTELLLLLGLSVALMRALRDVASPVLAGLLPLATVGAYYCAADVWHLTQPAVLMSTPLFLSLWCASPRAAAVSRTHFASGLFAGLALLFKFVVLPIPLGFWISSAVIAARANDTSVGREFVRRVFPATAGTVLVLGALALWLVARGAWDAFSWNVASFRPEALAAFIRHTLGRYPGSLSWFLVIMAPWVVLGCFCWVRWRGVIHERLTLQALIWIACGLGVIAIEPLGSWPFDFLLLLVPVGMLAIRGVHGLAQVVADSALAGRVSLLRFSGVALVLLAALPGMARLFERARPVFAVAPGDAWVARLRPALSPENQRIVDDTAFLRESSSLPGPIYVMGDPLYQLYSGRAQALATNGWGWESYTASQWATLANELEANRPVYLFVASYYAADLVEKSPATVALLSRNYRELKHSPDGAWYEVRTPH